MTTETMLETWNLTELSPFGVELTAEVPGGDLLAVPPGRLQDWVGRRRIAVLRGFAPPVGEVLTALGRRLGELLEWSFGTVNELRPREDAKNYLYTSRAVPFHWDGAFAGRVPHYILFHCESAPAQGDGGETLFCDAARLLAAAPPERRRLWEGVTVTYTTERIAHYGGSFTAPLIGRHPVSGESVLRFAEPVDDLNPVRLEVQGVPAAAREELLRDLHERLNDPALCHAHAWRAGDVVIADNHALLHGRRAFAQPAERHLRRVNIL
jgi:alpha-ketoglutarate-dependent taurine dioxygenase